MEIIQNPDFTLAVEYSDLWLEIRVNDILIFKNKGGSKTHGLWINDFIVDGKNSVQTTAAFPNNSENAGADFYSEAFARVSIQKNNIPVYTFLFPPESDSPPVLPATDNAEFESGTNHGLWTWEKSEKIQLNEEISKSATQHLHRLYKACQDKDIDRIIELFRIKFEEHAVAFYREEEEVFQTEREFFTQRLNNPVLELEKINDENILYELCAEQRMLSVKTLGEGDALKWIDYKGIDFNMPLYFSLISNEWIIAR